MARVRRATGARLSSSVRSGTRFGRSFAANALRLHLHALAYNLGNFMRTLAMPVAAEPWSLTSLRKKLIKIGAKVTSWLVGQVPDGRGRGPNIRGILSFGRSGLDPLMNFFFSVN